MTNAERQRKFYAKQRRAKIWGANSDLSARRPMPRRNDLDAALLDPGGNRDS
jgi:hypothetical protein